MKGPKNPFFGRKHTKEFKAVHSKRMKGNKNNGKVYKFIDSDNKEYIVEGSFYEFCKVHNLAISTMEKNLYNGTISKVGACKGWKVVKLSESTFL